LPEGMISPFGGTAAPTGWLLCDGSAVSRTTYATLFAAIGVAYGSGDGSTTFNLPDFRGRFMRGFDGTANNDPDKASRTASNTGGNSGNAVGSLQADAFQGHFHNFTPPKADSESGQGGITCGSPPSSQSFGATSTGAPLTDGTNGTPRTSSETRPKNVYVNYIIKH